MTGTNQQLFLFLGLPIGTRQIASRFCQYFLVRSECREIYVHDPMINGMHYLSGHNDNLHAEYYH